MSARLTDSAIQTVGKSANKAYLAATRKDSIQLARAVNSLADGLTDFATGLSWPEWVDAYLLIGKVLLLNSPQATPAAFGLA